MDQAFPDVEFGLLPEHKPVEHPPEKEEQGKTGTHGGVQIVHGGGESIAHVHLVGRHQVDQLPLGLVARHRLAEEAQGVKGGREELKRDGGFDPKSVFLQHGKKGVKLLNGKPAKNLRSGFDLFKLDLAALLTPDPDPVDVIGRVSL